MSSQKTKDGKWRWYVWPFSHSNLFFCPVYLRRGGTFFLFSIDFRSKSLYSNEYFYFRSKIKIWLKIKSSVESRLKFFFRSFSFGQFQNSWKIKESLFVYIPKEPPLSQFSQWLFIFCLNLFQVIFWAKNQAKIDLSFYNFYNTVIFQIWYTVPDWKLVLQRSLFD